MRNHEYLIPDVPEEQDLFQQEERCRRVLRTVGKSIFMRLFVTVILVLATLRTPMEPWVMGLMALVAFINLTGMLPLISEWKKQYFLLKEIIAQDEA